MCRVRDVLAALPVADLIETMRPLSVAPLGQTHPFVLGVAVIRGLPTPVVDPGVLLEHGPGAHATPSTRFVTVRTGARVIAVAVDEVLGLRRFASATLHALPRLVADAPMFGSLAALDDELVVWLRTARLVPDEIWRELDGSTGGA